MTIGVLCSAVWTVAVPEAVTATSADARTVSVSRSTIAVRSSVAMCVKQAVVQIRRPRHDELRVGHLLAYQGRGRGEDRQDPRNLVRAASRQQRHARRGRAETARAQEGLAWRRGRRQVHERMTDELDRNPMLPVQIFFERENHEHAVRESPNGVDPPRPPCPDLRADVVDDRNAQALDAWRQPEIEVGRIDDDERGGLLRPGRLEQPAPDREHLRNLRERLGEAGHGDPAVVGNQLAAGGLKVRSAEPGDLQIGLALPAARA